MIDGRTAVRAPWNWTFLAASLAIGLWARLSHVGDLSFWQDEGWTLFFAQAGLRDLLQENHPPLYYLLLRFLLPWAQGDGTQRALGSVASLATIWVIYRMSRDMGIGQTGAALAASSIALAGVDVEAARTLRMYPWFSLTFALALWAGWRWHCQRTRGRALAFLLGCMALCYIHGIGVFFAAAACLFVVVLATSWRERLEAAGIGLASLATFAPWLFFSTLQRLQLMNPDTGLVWRKPVSFGSMLSAPFRLFVDSAPIGEPRYNGDICSTTLWPALCDLLGFDQWRLRGYVPLLLFTLCLAVFLSMTLRHLRRTRQENRSLAALLLTAVLPIGALAAVERLVSPWFDVRYLIPLTVPLALMFGFLTQGAARSARAAGVAVLGVMAIAIVAFPQSRTNQEFRQAIGLLADVHRSGELVFVNAEGQAADVLMRRYWPQSAEAPVISLRNYLHDNYASGCPRTRPDCLDDLSVPDGAPQRAWMLRPSLRLDRVSRPSATALASWLDRHLQVVAVHSFSEVELLELRLRR